MKTKLSGLFLAVALAAGSLFSGARAQEEPVLSLRAPARVAAGQAFEVSYAINTRGSKNFQAPAFKGLDILFGPAQSQSSSFQFVNGKQSQSFSLSYTYQLRAPKAGNYDFGKASIEVGGTTYYSEPFTLTVTDAPQQAQQQTQGANRSDSRKERTSASVSGEDLYIRGTVSNRQPYVGEQVLLTYRIYTSIPVEQYSIYKTPSNKGFWTEELQVDPQSQRQENINGKQFVSADIRKVALFAQQAGAHTLEPLEVEAVAQVQAPRRARQSRSIFDMFEDDFFGSPTELVKKEIRSQSIRIQARPLPDENRPTSFDGLVGEYTLSFDYDRTQKPKVNDALTFTFTVAGKGNIEMIHAPLVQFPPDFEVYEPRISHKKTLDEDGVSGSATFEYIVVPRHAGAYKIPAFSYSFFNPATGKYMEKRVNEIVLEIEAGKDAAYTHAPNGAQTHGQDIAYIQTGVPSWKATGKNFLFSGLFWLCLICEALLFAAALVALSRNRKLQADVVGMKNRKAAKEAKKCLRKAARFLDENKSDEFHVEISQALWGFLSGKLNIATADLSMDNVRTELEKRQIEPALTDSFIQTLSHCEEARFAPGAHDAAQMKKLYDEALDAVYKMVGAIK